MDLSQLEVFLTVAREHRFSRPPKSCFAPVAVSQTIRKLEIEIGEPLFDRSSREGVLTDAGRVLQEYAEKLLNLRQDAQTALVEMRELQKGKLTIAANEFTALYLLPVLAEYRRLHPTIKITVRRSLGSHIPDDVLKHNVELGVLSYDPRSRSCAPPSCTSTNWRSSSRPAIPGLSGRSQRPPTGRGVVRRPHRGVSLSRQSDRSVPASQNPLHMDVELPTLQAIKRFVCMGNGVALVPEISVETKSLVETWCAFRSAICISAQAAPRVPPGIQSVARGTSVPQSGRAGSQRPRRRYRFQRENSAYECVEISGWR